ncbi:MAG: hypothetical protein CTY19_13980 [Methylomonas sp.]|nr:MAG: hypothetical protein CTY19_13980 [Methylomonas sp.]
MLINYFGYFFSKSVAVLFLMLAVFLASIYPGFNLFFIVVLVLYFLSLLLNNSLGLFFMLALLPVMDFGIWTGNIVFSEYDIFLSLTLACMFWFKRDVNFNYKNNVLFWFFLVWFLLCCAIGFFNYLTTYPVDDVYQSAWNAIHVGKGFIFSWFVWYVIRDSLITDYDKSLKLISAGVLSGLGLLALGILWERHIFASVVGFNSFYGFFSVLLDFASTYRVTGFFSTMHVGGTALDGYLVSVLPLAFFIVSRQRKTLYLVLATLVFVLGLYSIVVTFTRMTIASFAFSLVVAGIMMLMNNAYSKDKPNKSFHNFSLMIVFFLMIIVLVTAKNMAGYQALVSGVLVFLTSLIVLYINNASYIVSSLLVFIVFSLGGYGVFDSILDSKWHEDTDSSTAVFLGGVFSFGCALFGVLTSLLLKLTGMSIRNLVLPFVLGLAFLILMVGMGSTRMTERMHGVSSDIETRQHHWVDVINSANSDQVSTQLFGHGMGSMPKLYYQAHFDKMQLPTYRWNVLDGRSILEIGKGGYPFYQKLSLLPNTNYELQAVIKSEGGDGTLGLDICHKHILFSDRWQPDCATTSFKFKSTEWQSVKWTFNSGKLGQYGLMDWPTTLQLHNYSNSVIAIDAIQLTDASGKEWIKNGDFENKLNYWFWISDFEHLPWHSKQLFIHLWLEQGWIGLLLFILLIALILVNQLALFRSGKTIPIALIPSVCAILGLGLTDTFVDDPHTSLMVFGILFAALQWPNTTKRNRGDFADTNSVKAHF